MTVVLWIVGGIVVSLVLSCVFAACVLSGRASDVEDSL